MSGCVCPTCHRPLDVQPPHKSLTDAVLTNKEREIVDVLVAAYPRAVSTDAMLDAIYGDDPDGGPLDPKGIFAVLACRVRRKLPKHGWTITNNRGGRGNVGHYRLEPVR